MITGSTNASAASVLASPVIVPSYRIHRIGRAGARCRKRVPPTSCCSYDPAARVIARYHPSCGRTSTTIVTRHRDSSAGIEHDVPVLQRDSPPTIDSITRFALCPLLRATVGGTRTPEELLLRAVRTLLRCDSDSDGEGMRGSRDRHYRVTDMSRLRPCPLLLLRSRNRASILIVGLFLSISRLRISARESALQR